MRCVGEGEGGEGKEVSRGEREGDIHIHRQGYSDRDTQGYRQKNGGTDRQILKGRGRQ